MSAPQKTDGTQKLGVADWAPWPDMECLARLLAERGFRLSRGTWVPRDGKPVPTVCIDRPEQPEWGQKWDPWYAEKQHATDTAGEAQAALALAGEAIAKWDLDAFDFPLPKKLKQK